MRIVAVAAILLSLNAGCARGQSATLESRLRTTLEVTAAEPLVTERLTGACWPDIVFVRARPERMASGEDPRPALVAATITAADTVISSSWDDLPRVWQVLSRPTDLFTRSDAEVLECLLQLLNASAVMPRVRLLQSSSPALSSNRTWSSGVWGLLRFIGLADRSP
jgi:hypothetical protein